MAAAAAAAEEQEAEKVGVPLSTGPVLLLETKAVVDIVTVAD